MSALVERIIAARDLLGGVVEKERRAIIREALADAANALDNYEKTMKVIAEEPADHNAQKLAAALRENAKLEAQRDELLWAAKEAETTLATASRLLTAEHRVVLAGREWGGSSLELIRAAIAKAEGRHAA